MTVQSKPTHARAFAICVAALNAFMLIAAPLLSFVFAAHVANDISSLASLTYSIIAVLIIAWFPKHVVGWLMLVVGFFSALGEVTSSLKLVSSSTSLGLGTNLVVWINHLAWIPETVLPLTLILQFFPNGRLLSRRWWPLPVASLVAICGLVASYAFHPWPWEESGIMDTTNPFAIEGSEQFFESLFSISVLLLAASVTGTLVALIARFRRSRAIEREQMKWLVYVALVDIVLIVMWNFGRDLSTDGDTLGYLVFVTAPTIFALTIGISILRYRLFDIDVVIRKTLIYAALSTVLALVYFGSVTLLTSLFSAATGQQSALAIVISTLGIAALFNPLRRRVQDAIDRRFFRKKYDAQRVLAQFALTARDETDLDALTAELVRVVQETMQPEHVSVWLRETGLRNADSQ